MYSLATLTAFCDIPASSSDRVPTQIAFPYSLCFPFPTAYFPCANLRDLWLLKKKEDLSSFQKTLEIFAANLEISLRSGNLHLEQTIPCVWQIFPKFPVFTLTVIFCSFLPVFPVQWVPCYYIRETDLADSSSFNKNWTFLQQLSKYLLPLESGNSQLKKKCPYVLTKFPNSLLFPWQGISFGHLPLSLCSGYPVQSSFLTVSANSRLFILDFNLQRIGFPFPVR